MARRKKKEADPKPEPIEVPAEDPKAEPEVVMEPAGPEMYIESDPQPPEPETEPEPEKKPEYFLAPGVSQCTRGRIKTAGEQVYPSDFPGGQETIDMYIEKGLLVKR